MVNATEELDVAIREIAGEVASFVETWGEGRRGERGWGDEVMG